MPENNTLRRARLQYIFGMLAIYANIKNIAFIVFRNACSAEEQNKLFKQGLSNLDGYIKISNHQKDTAKDLVIIDTEGKPIWEAIPEYEVLGKFFESLGGKWGGRWQSPFDPYHFEL